MESPRFTPIDDDEPELNSGEFAAGYDARLNNAPLASSATRSWRAGWSDADMVLMSEPTTVRMLGDGGCTGFADFLMSDGRIETRRIHNGYAPSVN